MNAALAVSALVFVLVFALVVTYGAWLAARDRAHRAEVDWRLEHEAFLRWEGIATDLYEERDRRARPAFGDVSRYLGPLDGPANRHLGILAPPADPPAR